MYYILLSAIVKFIFYSFKKGALAVGHFQEKSEAALRSLLSPRRLHFLRFKGKPRKQTKKSLALAKNLHQLSVQILGFPLGCL